jgi:hypothetical protein
MTGVDCEYISIEIANNGAIVKVYESMEDENAATFVVPEVDNKPVDEARKDFIAELTDTIAYQLGYRADEDE